VFGAVSVATACLVPGSVAEGVAKTEGANGERKLDIEHPTGSFTVTMDVDATAEGVAVRRSALLRTARLLMRGEVLVPGEIS
jgi:4-oxalomesaconate tautomerase